MNIFKKISATLLLSTVVLSSFPFANTQNVQAATKNVQLTAQNVQASEVITGTVRKYYFAGKYNGQEVSYSDGSTVEPKTDSFRLVRKEYDDERIEYSQSGDAYVKIITYKYYISYHY